MIISLSLPFSIGMALSLSLCNSTVSPQHEGLSPFFLFFFFFFILSNIYLFCKFTVKVNLKRKIGLQNVKNLVRTVGIPSVTTSPQESLQNGNWVKLICGASFEVIQQQQQNPFFFFFSFSSMELIVSVSCSRMWLISEIYLLFTLLLEVDKRTLTEYFYTCFGTKRAFRS